MKKIFILIMTAIVGMVGYTVVDKTIEQRVETLESEVSYLKGTDRTTVNSSTTSKYVEIDPEYDGTYAISYSPQKYLLWYYSDSEKVEIFKPNEVIPQKSNYVIEYAFTVDKVYATVIDKPNRENRTKLYYDSDYSTQIYDYTSISNATVKYTYIAHTDPALSGFTVRLNNYQCGTISDDGTVKIEFQREVSSNINVYGDSGFTLWNIYRYKPAPDTGLTTFTTIPSPGYSHEQIPLQ